MDNPLIRFFLICWRDLWRNRRRTLLTGFAMIFAVAAMILFIGLGDGSHLQMIQSATDSFIGHLQIQQNGFANEPDLYHRLDPAVIDPIAKDLDANPEIVAWAPRIATGGLMSKKVPNPQDEDDIKTYTHMTAEGALIVGVSPPAERKVSDLAQSVLPDQPLSRCIRGCEAAYAQIYKHAPDCASRCESYAQRFEGVSCQTNCIHLCNGQCLADDLFCDETACLDTCNLYCEPSRFLADADPFPDTPYQGEIVLGESLANVLDVDVGDRVALTTGTAQGRTFASLYRVSGLVKTGSIEINRTLALTHREKLAEGLEIPGAATSLVIKLQNLYDADRTVKAFNSRIFKETSDVKALGWKEIVPELDIFVKIDQGSLLVTLVLLTMVVGVVIANIVTMSVMERTREYGVRMAMGESPLRLTSGMITEIVLLACLSGIIGGIVGEALNVYFQAHGIDLGLGELNGAGVIISSVIYTEVTLYGFWFSFGAVLFFSIAGAIFPAWRLHRLNPVDALKFV